MAVTSISAITSLISGTAAVTSIAGKASGDTVILGGPSGGPLDFNSLVIRITNHATGLGALVTLAVSSTYSSLDQGTYAVTVGTAGTVYVGGEDFESARFKGASSQAILMTFTTTTTSAATCSCDVEAVQAPYSHTG